jgi:D-amino-acid dehydrogenase
VVGVAGAWYLAAAGHDVVVIDRRAEPGLETSFANGGQVTGGHAEPWAKPSVVPKILGWLGREDAPLLFRARPDRAQWAWGLRFLRECMPGRFEQNCRQLAALALYSRECLRALRGRAGLEYDALSRGILHFCTSERDFEAMARHTEEVRKLGGTERTLKTAAECLQLEPTLAHSEIRVAGGVFTAEDESGDAYKFTRGLAARCVQRGVRFLANHPVQAIERQNDVATGVRLEDGQKIAADIFVVSLGSYSPLLLAPLGIRIPVYPMKGYSITLPLSPAEAPIAPTVSLTDEDAKIVISRLGNRLRAAGTAELDGYDTTINPVRCNAIVHRVKQLFPGLGAITMVERWAGLRPATPSNVPLIGRTRLRNLFLNTGHGTLGWTLACGSGRALSDIVAGRKPEVDLRFL